MAKTFPLQYYILYYNIARFYARFFVFFIREPRTTSFWYEIGIIRRFVQFVLGASDVVIPGYHCRGFFFFFNKYDFNSIFFFFC